MALVLAVGSGLMVRSFQALRDVDPGFRNPEEVLTARVTIPGAEIDSPEEVALAHELIEQQLRELGGGSIIGDDGWLEQQRCFRGRGVSRR